MEYILPQGTGPKKPHLKDKLTKLQYEIYQKCYDDINGPLFFAEHACWVNCNGIIRYKPYDYQREMIFNMHNYNSIITLCARQGGKCLDKNIDIKIRNKKTGKICKVSIGDFFNMIKGENKI